MHSRRDLSLAELEEMVPGYAPLDGQLGYEYDDPQHGRTRVLNAMPGDQVFDSEKFGRLNVSLALERIATEQVEPITAPVDEHLAGHIRLVEINEDWVRAMSVARRDEPVLLLLGEDGVNVVDGHHRLARLIRDRAEYFKAHLMRPESYGRLQVAYYLQDGSGWTLAPFMQRPDEVQAAIKRAEEIWADGSFMRDAE